VKDKVYRLNIESGIGGGSVSVVENGKVLDYQSGKNPVGKADFLIEQISDLLKKNKLEKSKIASVIYSEYPGSHTGLKIGGSIAKGLHLGLNCVIKSKDLFECIFKNYSGVDVGKFLIVLPVSGADFVWRIYDAEGLIVDSGQSNLAKDGVEDINFCKNDGLTIFMPFYLFDGPGRIYKKFDLDKGIETVDLGKNLSGYLAVG
jgi:tRNA A37 threonylcarbamoyladenosine modification protein TsaB